MDPNHPQSGQLSKAGLKRLAKFATAEEAKPLDERIATRTDVETNIQGLRVNGTLEGYHRLMRRFEQFSS